MTPYTQLYDDCAPELPGVPPALLLHHIKRACNDFYERSLFVRQDLTPINVVANTATYALAVADPTNYDITKVMSVLLDGKPLWPKTVEALDVDTPNWRTDNGVSANYTQTALNSLTIAYVPVASITAGLKVNVAVVPQYGGGGVDDAVYSKWAEVLAAGAKYRLMQMRKKPWSDAQEADRLRRYFDAETAGAAAVAARGHGRAPLRCRASP
jgi:hypothetical protein